jgi:hypothetical protein
VHEDRLPAIDELVAIVEARAAGEPYATRLQLAIDVGRELTDLGDVLIGRFVAQARDAGLSWTEIGQLFGTSKQAVQQRYGTALADPGGWPGRWTSAARNALDRAAAEARALGHDYGWGGPRCSRRSSSVTAGPRTRRSCERWSTRERT